MSSNQQYDVAIIGGGIAGLSAALTAIRKSFKVVLIEKTAKLGGILEKAYLQEICGLFYGTDKPILLNDGLSKEIYDTIKSKSGRPVKHGRVFTLPFKKNDLIHFFTSKLENDKNIEIIYNQSVTDFEVNNHHITSIILDNNKIFAVKNVINCGSANNLLLNHGLSKQNPNEQLGAVFFTISSLDQIDSLFSIKIPYILKQAVIAGNLPHHAQFTSVSKLSDHTLLLKLNIPYPTDKTIFIELIHSIFECLIQDVPNLKGTLNCLSNEVAPRSAPLFKGKYILTENDIINGTSRIKSTLKGSWPIEFWNHDIGVKFSYTTNNQFYDIPDDTLRSGTINNLYAAGCSISTTPKAQAATRVIGTCIATAERSINLI